MKFEDNIPRLQKTVADIIWNKKKITTIGDFFSIVLNNCGKNYFKTPYSKVELVEHLILLIDLLDENLKNQVVNIFFVDFLSDSINFEQYKVEPLIDNHLYNIIKKSDLGYLNKYIFHKEIVQKYINKQHYDLMFNVLDDYSKNLKEDEPGYSLFSLLNYMKMLSLDKPVLKDINDKEREIFINLIDTKKNVALNHLKSIKSEVIFSIVDNPEALTKVFGLFKDGLIENDVQWLHKAYTNKILTLNQEKQNEVLSKLNIEKLYPIIKVEVKDDVVDVRINKNNALLVNYWYGVFRDFYSKQNKNNITNMYNIMNGLVFSLKSFYMRVLDNTLLSSCTNKVIKSEEKTEIVLSFNLTQKALDGYFCENMGLFFEKSINEIRFQENFSQFEEPVTNLFEEWLMKNSKEMKKPLQKRANKKF